MVLYCIEHGAGIFRGIIHKFKYHPQDDAVFFVDKDASSLYCPPIDKIKYYRMPDPWEIARYSPDSKEAIKEHTNQVISDFFKETDLDPLQFSHIYAIFDEFNPFILYFEMNSIKYMSIENGNSIFNRHLKENFIKFRPPETRAYSRLIFDMHLQDARGKNCTKGYLFSDQSPYEAKDVKTPLEVFGFHDALINLDDEHKRKIIEGYNIAQYDFDTVLILSSTRFTQVRFMTYELEMPSKYTREDENGAVYYFFKTIIDYYFNDVDYILKLHPQADENFVKAFAGYKQLPREVPMEAFFLLEKKFDIICPLNSDGLDIFKKYNFNAINFGLAITALFKYIHFLFIAFTLINAICVPAKINVFGIDQSQLDTFVKWVYKPFKNVEFYRFNRFTAGNAVFVVADPLVNTNFVELIQSVPEECLIIANGNWQMDGSVFASQEMICTLTDISDDRQEEVQRSSWTALSKSKELIEAVKDFSVSYTLENAKVLIQSSPHT